jgi:hypothetical protein
VASPTTLNQILAVRQGIQADTRRDVTDLHREVGKAPLLSGVSRTYRKLDDDAPDLTAEHNRVQVVAADVVREVGEKLIRLFDVTAVMDWTNQKAKADIVIDGEVLLRDVPATYLLFLEKQLVDLETFMRKLPVLDPAEVWTWNEAANAWASEPAETTRTAKVPKAQVLYPATDKHPAQVQAYTEDVIVGYWRTIRFSGAMQAQLVEKLTKRVVKLAEAVKFAREQANMTAVVDPKPGAALFDYLLSDLR